MNNLLQAVERIGDPNDTSAWGALFVEVGMVITKMSPEWQAEASANDIAEALLRELQK